MVMAQSWPWGSKTAVKKTLPKWQMVTWIQSFFQFPSQAVTKTEHTITRSKTPDT